MFTTYRYKCLIPPSVLIFSFLLLSSCSLIEPGVEPDKIALQAYNQQPNLPNAITVANSIRDEYGRKVDNQILLTRAVGLTLIPMAAGAAGLGIRSEGPDGILALGLTGASLYTATTFLTSKQQQYIYAAGANAVTCALDVIHPLRVAYIHLPTLKLKLAGDAVSPSFPSKIRALEQLLSGFQPNPQDPLDVRARLAVQEAKDMSRRAEEAINVLERSGGDLMSTVQAIQAKVRTAIVDSSPNLQALVESLGQSLPLLGSRVTGASLSAAPKAVPKEGVKHSLDPATTLLVLTPVEETTFQIGLIVNKVGAKPVAESLKTCNVDLTKSGLAFQVTPSGEIAVDAGSDDPNVTIMASGGVLPYRSQWIGQTPGKEVKLTVESGLGIVTVAVVKGTPDSAYTLLVQDAVGAKETVIVKITGGSGVKPTPPAALGVKATPGAKDPTVEKIQNDLLSVGIKTVKVGDQENTLLADGVWGPTTEAAIRKYLIEQAKLQEKDLPKDKDALIKDFQTLFKKPS